VTGKRLLTLLLGLIASAATGAGPSDKHDWDVTDVTNNDTRLRSVSALAVLSVDPEMVMLWLECEEGRPALRIEWYDVKPPKFAVISIGVNGDVKRFSFERSDEPTEDGLVVKSEDAEPIIRVLGNDTQVGMTLHLDAGDRVASGRLAGTQAAWSRVKNWCPTRKDRT
jgi:hypothetical protein